MYTLYGKKGSGSASTQAALDIIGAPYRIVETASWAPNDAFNELLQLNPLGQIPTLVLPDGRKSGARHDFYSDISSRITSAKNRAWPRFSHQDVPPDELAKRAAKAMGGTGS